MDSVTTSTSKAVSPGIGLRYVRWLAVLIAAVALPVIASTDFYRGILFYTLLWAGVAGAWNLLGGLAGQFSLGHAAFFGLGAYTSTLLFVHRSLSPWLGMVCGAALCCVIGGALGWVCFRLRGHFYALATLAFGEVAYMCAVTWRELTGGSEGLLVPIKAGVAGFYFENKVAYVYVALGYAALVAAIMRLVSRSRLGYYLLAYREDDDAARSLGVNTFGARVVASALSAALTAVGGTVYAQYVMFIEPDSTLAVTVSVQAALIAIVGGLGSAAGPILGSFLILPLTQFLRGYLGSSISGLHFVIYGAVLVVVMLSMPQGLVSRLGAVGRLRVGGKRG